MKWAAPAVAVETRAEHSDHAAVLADLDPELHGLALGVPALGRRGWGTMSFAVSSSIGAVTKNIPGRGRLR